MPKRLYTFLIVALLFSACKKDPAVTDSKSSSNGKSSQNSGQSSQNSGQSSQNNVNTTAINQQDILGTWYSVGNQGDPLKAMYFGPNNFYYQDYGSSYSNSYATAQWRWISKDSLNVVYGTVAPLVNQCKVIKLTKDSLFIWRNIFFDNSKNYFKYYNAHLPLLDSTAVVTTIAGGNVLGQSGDGGLAKQADLEGPAALTIDQQGNIYFFDLGYHTIRKISSSTGIINRIVGVESRYGNDSFLVKDNTPLLSAILSVYIGSMAIDKDQNLYFTMGISFPFMNTIVYKVVAGDPNIHVVTGMLNGYSGDGGLAKDAATSYIGNLQVDALGDLYVSDQLGAKIRKINRDGIITTIAGNGVRGNTGDGGKALNASINAGPMAIDKNGNLFFADYSGNSIRRIDAISNVITTIAGNGKKIYYGDQVPALSASFTEIRSLVIDQQGNIITSEVAAPLTALNNNRVRMIKASTGIISTIAGNEYTVYSGDGHYTKIRSMMPYAIALDPKGNVIVSDLDNNRIRMVSGY